jgi:hypothetical protein
MEVLVHVECAVGELHDDRLAAEQPDIQLSATKCGEECMSANPSCPRKLRGMLKSKTLALSARCWHCGQLLVAFRREGAVWRIKTGMQRLMALCPGSYQFGSDT